MITKERLVQLINKKSIIYYLDTSQNILKIDLSHYKSILTSGYFIEILDNEDRLGDYEIDKLFENTKQVIEFKNYANITQVRKFPYVSYEDFLKGNDVTIPNLFVISKHPEFDIIVVWDSINEKETIIDHATRENYHKALGICLKIWREN